MTENITRTENEHETTFGFHGDDWVAIFVLTLALMIFGWQCLLQVREMNALPQCTADAKSPAGLLQIHIERYGDCDPAAVAAEARVAVLPPEEETQ